MRYSLTYTTADIDGMVWEDYIDLHRYWKKCPPTHIMAAGFAGYKPAADIDKNANQDFALEELINMFGVRVVPKEEIIDVQ